MICPNLHAFRFQETLEVGQKQLILKDAAGKYNCIDPVRATKNCHDVAETLSNSVLERARNFLLVPATERVADDAIEQRAKVQFIAHGWKRICVGPRRMAGKALKPHRGLPFERNFACETKQGRRGVEEASHGSGAERSKLCVHELQSVQIAGRK